MTNDLVALREEIRVPYQNEEFARTSGMVEAARSRHAEPEWLSEVDKLLAEIRSAAARAYGPLKEKAVDASRRGAVEELRAHRDRLTKWGLADLSADLEKAIALAPPPAPPPPAPSSLPLSKEAELYGARSSAAFLLAAGRDYPGAIALLEPQITSVKEDGVRKEAAADLEALRWAQAVPAEAMAQLAKWPADHEISLDVYDGTGKTMPVGGIPRLEASRLLLKKGPSATIVETGEIAPGSLVALFLDRKAKRPESDSRAAAYFCIFEGDPESAEKFAGASPLPERFLAHARKLSGERLDPASPEGKARGLFFSAELEFQNYASRVDAIQKFKSLLKESPECSFVRRNRASITNRSESGKDYFFFPSQMTAGGSFRLQADPKGETSWISGSDSPKEKARENFVQLAFSTLPDTTYRCWAYVGGCCAETMTFYLQATDLSGPSADGKETVSMNPGDDAFVPVKHGWALVAKHAAHPKQTMKWGWVSVPLPKFSESGAKRVRLLSCRQGFSVAYALVSSVRQAPPGEAELKKMEKPSGPGPLASGLEAYWKFDEGRGTAVADSSGKGNHGSLVRKAQWVEGKIGGALYFDRDNYVMVPHSDSLAFRAQDSFAVSLWANVPSPGGGWRAVFAKSRDTAPHYGIWVSNQGKWFFGGNEKGIEGCPVTPGWHHIVILQNGATHERSLYVDGAKCGTGPAADANGPGELRIGAAKSVNEYLTGTVDEVRVYSRALSPAEITLLGQSP